MMMGQLVSMMMLATTDFQTNILSFAGLYVVEVTVVSKYDDVGHYLFSNKYSIFCWTICCRSNSSSIADLKL